MTVNIPEKVRIALYVLTALSAPAIAYLNTTGVIGEDEVNLYFAYVTVIAAMAGFNVPSGRK